MTLLYYGDGKGKTTAAMGLALRCLGHGLPVVILQFLKSANSGEIKALEHWEGSFVLRGAAPGFAKDMSPQQLDLTRAIHQANGARALELVSLHRAKLLVLDEVLDAYTLGLLDREALLSLLREPPAGLEIVLTGHSLPSEIAPLCDCITRMEKIRHAYDQGQAARKGIEF